MPHVTTRLLCPRNFPGKNTFLGRLSFPTAGDLPDTGIKPKSPVSHGFFTTVSPGKLFSFVLRTNIMFYNCKIISSYKILFISIIVCILPFDSFLFISSQVATMVNQRYVVIYLHRSMSMSMSIAMFNIFSVANCCSIYFCPFLCSNLFRSFFFNLCN